MKKRPFEGKESLSLMQRKPLFKLKKGSLCFLSGFSLMFLTIRKGIDEA